MKIDFTTLIVLLIVLKIFGIINLSWWIILFPVIAICGLLIFTSTLLFLALIIGVIIGTPTVTYKKKSKLDKK